MYRIYFCAGGLWCGRVDGEQAQVLRVGVRSLTSAMKICERDHGAKLEWDGKSGDFVRGVPKPKVKKSPQ